MKVNPDEVCILIPTLNDLDQEFEEIAQFIRSLGSEVPWHISAFYPTYKMTNLPRTSASSLHRAREIGMKAGLRYVYCGNIPGEEGEDEVVKLSERLIGRFSCDDVVNPQKPKEILVKANEEIDEIRARQIETSGVEKVKIRSVLTCESKHGVCVLCYGRNLATGGPMPLDPATGVVFVLAWSHKTAPVEIREKLAVPESRLGEALG
jgi:hypothetical protein